MALFEGPKVFVVYRGFFRDVWFLCEGEVVHRTRTRITVKLPDRKGEEPLVFERGPARPGLKYGYHRGISDALAFESREAAYKHKTFREIEYDVSDRLRGWFRALSEREGAAESVKALVQAKEEFFRQGDAAAFVVK